VTLDHLLFLVMSLIWGATWIATKAGLAAVPPFFFGAARYILVSAVMAFIVRDLRSVFRGRALRIIVSGTLVVAGTYAFIYWGMQYVASGVSGVVNMSMNRSACSALRSCSGRSGRPGGTRSRSCWESAVWYCCFPARRR
jgi:drug/metabolite transporter (DMT)-like permease